MPRIMGTLAIGTMIVLGPILFSNAREDYRKNFRVTEPGVFYRSGQLSREGLEQAIAEHKIQTVVSFRYADEPGGLPPDIEEERYCESRGIRYHRVRPREWSSTDGVPAAESVSEFRDLLSDDSAYPMLIHCFAGMHRTGVFCAIFRMEECGWSPEEAVREMMECGYTNLGAEWDVSTFIHEYEAGMELSP